METPQQASWGRVGPTPFILNLLALPTAHPGPLSCPDCSTLHPMDLRAQPSSQGQSASRHHLCGTQG